MSDRTNTLPQNPENGVEIENVSKLYRLSTDPVDRFSSFFIHRLVTHHRREELWALQDVSFDVQRGRLTGIIGPNGAGKSTLLRVILGITKRDTGSVRHLPRVAALLDIAAGFHGSLTGYENLFLAGALLGLEREELRRKLPDIVAFSGIDHARLETAVRYYSAGMLARLGFALCAHTDPDVVLIDEVLAVGDLEFQARSARRLLQFREEGKAMVMVSHLVGAIAGICDEVVWLDAGRVRQIGKAAQVVREYNIYMSGRIQARSDGRSTNAPELAPAMDMSRSGEIVFKNVTLDDGEGKRPEVFETYKVMRLRATLAPAKPVRDADLVVTLYDEVGYIIDEFLLSEKGVNLPELNAPLEITFRYPWNPLLRCRYYFILTAVEQGNPRRALGQSEKIHFAVEMPYDDMANHVATMACEYEMR